MTLIVSADLHLTDNPRDAHRWDLLPWLADQARKNKAQAILLLGDITDAKDKHSAVLTNKMVDGLSELAEVCRVVIIKGNHDYIDENQPFFGFMDRTRNIDFLVEPTLITNMRVGKIMLLPNTRDYEKDWADHWDQIRSADFVFTHQTYDGCLTETGYEMRGIPPSVFAKIRGKVISGDIHKPQKVGKNIEYVGAPYRCRFGDDYKPRVLLINDDGQAKDLRFPTKGKFLVELDAQHVDDVPRAWARAEDKYKLRDGDQVKVRVRLPRSAYADWPAIRQAVIEKADGLELTGPELVAAGPAAGKSRPADKGNIAKGGQTGPAEALTAYADAKGVPDALLATGRKLLKQAQAAK